MSKLAIFLVIGFSLMGFLGFMSAAATSSAENRPEAFQVQRDTAPGRCTGPIPEYSLRCADGIVEGPFWVGRYGGCQLVPACFDHGGPIQIVGPRIVGAGEECNGSLPPEYATLCDEDLTCVIDNNLLGSSGTCMTIGHLGDRCDSNRTEIRWVHCEEGLQCKPLSSPIAVGIVALMFCQQ